MRKVLGTVVLCMMMALLIAGCGAGTRSEVVGTWYGDNDDMLTLNPNGSYASTWLGTGKFSVEGDTLQLSGDGMAEGSNKQLVIEEDNGKKLLKEENLAVAYYASALEAAAAIEKQKEAILEEEAQRAAKELEELKKTLIGTWEWSGYAGEVVFGEDGTITGTVSGMKAGTYEVIDKNNIKVSEADRVYTERIVLTQDTNKTKLTFGILNLVKK